MGYTGGTRENPTYHALGDHSETVQLDYDPAVITYEELGSVPSRARHDATQRVGSRQYMSAVFYHDGAQERLARETKAELERKLGKTVHTEILPASTFYMAEDYHQKYGLQGDRLVLDEYRRESPHLWDIVVFDVGHSGQCLSLRLWERGATPARVGPLGALRKGRGQTAVTD